MAFGFFYGGVFGSTYIRRFRPNPNEMTNENISGAAHWRPSLNIRVLSHFSLNQKVKGICDPIAKRGVVFWENLSREEGPIFNSRASGRKAENRLEFWLPS